MKTRKQAQRAEMPNDNARGLDHAASGAVLAIGRLQANPEAVLLTSTQIAAKLNVPPSWIREKTRKRALVRDEDPLPVVRLGKYTRFDWKAISEWLERQSKR
ncbi:MAG: helix-turn-helix domain-containing protein [Candidatus Acidiferrales bacterium]